MDEYRNLGKVYIYIYARYALYTYIDTVQYNCMGNIVSPRGDERVSNRPSTGNSTTRLVPAPLFTFARTCSHLPSWATRLDACRPPRSPCARIQGIVMDQCVASTTPCSHLSWTPQQVHSPHRNPLIAMCCRGLSSIPMLENDSARGFTVVLPSSWTIFF